MDLPTLSSASSLSRRIVLWTGFALLAAPAMLAEWALHCLLRLTFFDLRSAMFRAVLTIAIFPVASFALGRTQRALIGAAG